MFNRLLNESNDRLRYGVVVFGNGVRKDLSIRFTSYSESLVNNMLQVYHTILKKKKVFICYRRIKCFVYFYSRRHKVYFNLKCRNSTLSTACESAAWSAALSRHRGRMDKGVSSYVYGVFGAQRSRDCTVTVLVSQIKRGHVTAL